MTFKEKLQELSRVVDQRGSEFYKIERDFKHSGFQEFTFVDYRNAHSAHADAVNNHGKVITIMFESGYSPDDEYVDYI